MRERKKRSYAYADKYMEKMKRKVNRGSSSEGERENEKARNR